MIARGGRTFVVVSAVAAAALLLVNVPASAALWCLTGFLAFVFRDPGRRPGPGVVSPADGTVREVDGEKGLVSIYLALRNVHVTRAPLPGVVTGVERSAGRHRPAFNARSPENERVLVSMETRLGPVKVMHISGILARRIVPYIGRGDKLGKADKLGLIRFGSRVDLALPPAKVAIRVREGDRVRAGVSCVAEVLDDSAG